MGQGRALFADSAGYKASPGGVLRRFVRWARLARAGAGARLGRRRANERLRRAWDCLGQERFEAQNCNTHDPCYGQAVYAMADAMRGEE